ncbi:MAG: hypothetical protein K2I36_01160 [Ureaplasma sp.]|nr:hypothetical protein [Ureaplasma sp.]MDE7222128.1 hypothetical protein [Ureaplasma sp.]
MKNDKSKITKLKKILYNIFIGQTLARKLLMFYVYAILLGIIFLSLPISLVKPGFAIDGSGTERSYNFLDSLFISISAFTDTGLANVNVLGTYNIFGQFVIIVLIQVGGLGLFTLYWMGWNLIFNSFIYKKIHKIPLSENRSMGFGRVLMIDSERGNSKLGLSSKTIKVSLIFIFSSELIFAIIYILMFALVPSYNQIDAASITANSPINLSPEQISSLSNLQPGIWYVDSTIINPFYHNAGLSIWTGIFQSISTMNNAGFDIIGASSYGCFRNGIWTIFLYISTIQIIIGGIGYPVIYDLINYFKYRYHCEKFRFSLFTKVTTITYFLVFVFGLVLLVGFEYGLKKDGILYHMNSNETLQMLYFGASTNSNNTLYQWNLFSSLFYNVIASRSNGAATISQGSISFVSRWVINILMFIGCSPSSTGGGIRTTSLAIIFMTVISYMRGFNETKIFKKTIPNKTVVRSSMIVLFSAIAIFLFAFISYPLALNLDPSNSITITDVIFEFSSAYGTVGLSSGLSSLLFKNDVNAYLIMILLSIIMIIGQLGTATVFTMFRSKSTNRVLSYPYEDIKI